MITEFVYEGGPLDGQHQEFEGTTDWWGFSYKSGTYRTLIGSYDSVPPRLFWVGPGQKVLSWVPDLENLDDAALEDHIRRLLDGNQSR